ncbi:cytochrome p450 [Hirsutella rhossiliensis]|uniref:Cytochrome p450 domain-containing protein n=1 Tax=Hirsutella rhossiliensis TaxID=111463 RepID=A0A9P8MWH1_9HYPO|nr:cytochrome p450 domain-containing protein [Hirsutella rhossiliensis]KAH0961496.1 cytochrome p450 domain-containing protein [Hirsutella rhossiliensis]
MSQPIPRPSGVPILGNIFDVKPGNPWASLKKLAEEHGEIFQIKILGKTIVFVASVALAEEICDEKRFRKYVGGPVVEIRAAVHDALFTAYDHEASWGIAHRIIAPYLQPDALADNFEQMRDTASELIELWKASTEPVCPWRDLAKLDLETLTLTLYGRKLNCLSGPHHPMIKAMEDSTGEAMQRPTRPGILNWLLYRGKFNLAIKAMREYAADLVQYRKEHPSDRQDLLSALMSAKDPETGESLTESQVLDEVVSMPIGSSTAPCLLATIIFLLLKNPDAIVKARKEIDVVVGAEGDLSHAHLAQLKYIEAIVREGLRLSFAAPGFNIEPIPSGGPGSRNKSPVLLGGGKYQVAHNQAMIIVMAGVNRDPAVFEEPLAFRPERMMGDEFERLPAGAKKWFGNGKRECIGKHYAWQWTMIVLTKMLREVDFAMVDADYKLEQDGWFNVRPIDFNVKIRARAV